MNLEVKVRTGRIACAADLTDFVARFYNVANLDAKLCEMRVKGLDSVAVIDNYTVTVTAIPIGSYNNTVCSGICRIALASALVSNDIDTVMGSAPSGTNVRGDSSVIRLLERSERSNVFSVRTSANLNDLSGRCCNNVERNNVLFSLNTVNKYYSVGLLTFAVIALGKNLGRTVAQRIGINLLRFIFKRNVLYVSLNRADRKLYGNNYVVVVINNRRNIRRIFFTEKSRKAFRIGICLFGILTVNYFNFGVKINLFGIGNAFDGIVSLVAYAFLLKKEKINILSVE